MNINELHIVSLKIPYPIQIGADYELFYKIKAFHGLGVKVHLHCFYKNKEAQSEALSQYCQSVNYYKRKLHLSLTTPYIVSSRNNNLLKDRLLEDNLPILLDGMHCASICTDNRFKQRNIVIRAHNVEYLYYKGLYQSSSFGLKKLYYKIESLLIKKFEAKMAKEWNIACLSKSDALYFKQMYNANKTVAVPVFFESKFTAPEGIGSFCLYHGNLSVSENEKAVRWLIEHVFANTQYSFVIAGRNPSKALIEFSHAHHNTCIAVNPSDAEMKDLIQKAQINILPSINDTGVKLKLLEALHSGRFCLTNLEGANGFEEKELFLHASDANAIKQIIDQYLHKPFTQTHIAERKRILEMNYSIAENAKKLLGLFEK